MRSGLLVLLLALAPTAVAAADAPAPPALQVTLVGTGDPLPRIDRFGPATLVVAGEHTLLFDVGRGTLQRLRQVGVSTGSLDAIFLTHLHSDHVVGLVDLWLSGWVVNARDRPLKLYGPVGTRAMVEHLVALCRSLGVSVVAEQVETEDHAETLRKLGVDMAQGWRFGRPTPDLVTRIADEPAARRKGAVQAWG